MSFFFLVKTLSILNHILQYTLHNIIVFVYVVNEVEFKMICVFEMVFDSSLM